MPSLPQTQTARSLSICFLMTMACALLAGCSGEDEYMKDAKPIGPEELTLKIQSANVDPMAVALDDKVVPPKNVFDPKPWQAPGFDPTREFSAQSNNIAHVFYVLNGIVTPSIAGHVPEDIQQGIDYARTAADSSTDPRVKPLILEIVNDLQVVADAEKIEALLRNRGMHVTDIAWGAGDRTIETGLQKELDQRRGGLSPTLEDRDLMDAALAFERKHSRPPDQVKQSTLSVVRPKLDQLWAVIEQARKEAGKHPIERNPSP